jgi:UDP-N-acetylmuramate-alanine ligase
MKIMPKIKKPIITYGESKKADYRAKNINYSKNKSKYDLFYKNKNIGEIRINVPGKHNVLNSLAAIALGMEINVPINNLKRGINSYKGVRRRFEIKKNKTDIILVDDYAHHPTEVNATIRAAKNGWNKRIISVFQPHLFSRTRDFFKEFALALLESDEIIITEIYAAREEPIDDIKSKLILDELILLGHNNTHHLQSLDNLNSLLTEIVKPGDMVITMGAGNIWRYSDKYNQYLNDNHDG